MKSKRDMVRRCDDISWRRGSTVEGKGGRRCQLSVNFTGPKNKKIYAVDYAGINI
jgi:hypothetical protein